MQDDIAARQMTLQRQIAAPPQRVWRMWTDPDLLPRWFGPAGWHCRTKEIDLRPGGVWRFDMIGPASDAAAFGAGMVFANRHRILAQDPPARLEFLLDGDDDAEAPAHVLVTLEPVAGGTLLTQVVTFPDKAQYDVAAGFGAAELGQTTLDKLAALAETPDQG